MHLFKNATVPFSTSTEEPCLCKSLLQSGPAITGRVVTILFPSLQATQYQGKPGGSRVQRMQVEVRGGGRCRRREERAAPARGRAPGRGRARLERAERSSATRRMVYKDTCPFLNSPIKIQWLQKNEATWPNLGLRRLDTPLQLKHTF
ncbi:hypothetical protein PVAP13_7KG008900 [Panicum virgatum]|uniref:Uncharacterized protein n=1 Tax=Panicum virgatum TaxID=38727 RepID=A0A8T0Q909_PANVG|nr:hypothetical protein PVAP13_7KG008900 [Panicum virgatum]